MERQLRRLGDRRRFTARMLRDAISSLVQRSQAMLSQLSSVTPTQILADSRMNGSNMNMNPYTVSEIDYEQKTVAQISDLRYFSFIVVGVFGLVQLVIGCWFSGSLLHGLYSVRQIEEKRNAIVQNVADDLVAYVLMPLLMIAAGGLWVFASNRIINKNGLARTLPYLFAGAVAAYLGCAILDYRVH